MSEQASESVTMSTADAEALTAESKQLNANRIHETRFITERTHKRVNESKEEFGSLNNPFCDIPENLSTECNC